MAVNRTGPKRPGSHSLRKTKKKNNQNLLIGIGVLILILIAVTIFYFVKVNFYKTHFRNGSTINGIDFSGKTVEEVEQAINEQVRTYEIRLTGRNDMEQTIASDDFGYHYAPDGSVSRLLKEQNHYLWFQKMKGQEADMEVPTDYDEDLLSSVLSESIFFQKELDIKPRNASVSFSETSGYFIEKEVMGNRVKKAALLEAVKNVISEHETALDLDKAGLYRNPKLRSDNKKLIRYCKLLNRYTSHTITYDFDDRKEVLDREKLHDFIIKDDENFTVTIDENKVREYVNFLGYEYDTFSYTRDFKTHNGRMIKVSGGDYGWLINRPKETEELIKAIRQNKDIVREPVYTYTAKSRKINDIGDTYIEVDLTAQHMWIYKDGSMVLDTDFVSGDVSRKRETPTGVFAILYKERDAQLVGETYNTKVSYWMPFYDNCGIHDAGWRTAFGGDIYLKDGSHGCLNSPPAMAKAIYETIDAKTPIIVYKGPKARKYRTDPNGKRLPLPPSAVGH